MIKYRRDLWQLVSHLPTWANAVEIGVAEGYFSADLLAMPINFPRVYMVDPWRCLVDQKGDGSQPSEWHERNLAATRARVAPFGERAVILRGCSAEMAQYVPNRTLSLCYIDGDHSYQGVKTDIEVWYPKLIRGGVMAFHDYEMPEYGVKTALHEFCQGKRIIHLLPEDKTEDAGAYIYANPL